MSLRSAQVEFTGHKVMAQAQLRLKYQKTRQQKDKGAKIALQGTHDNARQMIGDTTWMTAEAGYSTVL
jgi:hypothetical protein